MGETRTPDLIVRNARIVDGTGRPAFHADVVVDEGRIVGVDEGTSATRAREEIDASGRILTPGFIDVHTHYDAQLCWDGLASPSPLHGVTTICIGNCSLSLAPVRPSGIPRLVGMFQAIEDIREATFDAGVGWEWESFADYLGGIRRRLAVNVVPLVGHSALRLYVMGEASQQRIATDAELETMCDHLRDAIRAGARGLSTSYLDVDENLDPVPSRFADLREKIALARAAFEAGGSLLEAVPEAGDAAALEANIRELGEISRQSGLTCTIQPVIYLPTQPDLWRRTLGWLSEEAARGARIFGQSPPGPMDFNLRLDETFFTFFLLPAWGDVMRRPPEERAALFRDLGRRPALREQGREGLELFLPNAWVGETYSEANAGLVGRRVFDIAEERGVDPVDALIDIALHDDLHTAFAIRAPMHGSPEIAAEILRHEQVIVGASDAGAHLTQFCGAGDATYFLSEYVRKRGVFTLEQAVHQLTGRAAALLGLEDRGRIEVGAAADLVLLDLDRLDPGPEVFVRDLPGGGHRYLRRPGGVDAVWVAGRRIVDHGEYTDERPGRIV